MGDVPMPTTVPTATPALLTPAKNSGWYAAMAATASASGTGGQPRNGSGAPADSSDQQIPPPSATRTAPTATGEASSGPSARLVPVVPHSVAAATTSSDGGSATGRDFPCSGTEDHRTFVIGRSSRRRRGWSRR